MKFDRFDYSVGAVLAGLTLALLGLIWAGYQQGARVSATLPPPGEAVGAYSRIGLTFAQPMQARSVESAFRVEPAVPGAFQWEGSTLWFVPAQPFQPQLTYTARVAAGALSVGGLRLQRDVTWTFTVRTPWIVYVSPVNGPREVWRVRPYGSGTEQLSHTAGQVYDLAVSRDGERIAYSVLNEQNGFDLWGMTIDGGEAQLMLECGSDRCSTPAWSPDGERVAYSRENTGLQPSAPKGPPRLWVLDLITRQTGQTFSDSQILGYGPSWSPDGRRLAVFDGSVNALRVLEIATGQTMLLPTAMGVMGAWSPDSAQMVFSDLNLSGEQPTVSLLRADFATQTIAPLAGSNFLQADYGPPAWSPTGEWLAVSQRVDGGGPGKQIWLLRPDGASAQSVTTDPAYTHGGYHWDAWGTALTYQRFPMGVPFAVPEIVVWEAASGAERVLAQDASLPTWAP